MDNQNDRFNIKPSTEPLANVADERLPGNPGDVCVGCGQIMAGPVIYCPYCGKNSFKKGNDEEKYNV